MGLCVCAVCVQRLMHILYLDILLCLTKHIHIHAHTHIPYTDDFVSVISCLAPGSEDGRPYPDNGASKLDLRGSKWPTHEYKSH